MFYTLAMAADQEPQIAEDGVQEVPLTIARPLLSRLIEQALEEGVTSALTVRGRRRVYLATPTAHDQATQDRALAEALSKANPELYKRLVAEIKS